jgi:hypothetical protein
VATTVARLQAVLGAQTRDFDRAMDRSESKLSGIGKTAGIAGAAIATGVVMGAKEAIGSANDLNESINAVNVVFGDASKQVLNFSKNAASKAGLSMRAFNELVTPVGASLQNVGFSADQAAKQSINLAKRAADMASVFNVDVKGALAAIQSGLRGEADPLEKFGVGLSDAAVKAKAMNMGLAESEKQLTANDKAQARLKLIFEQTNKLAGDFTNTSDGLANSQRIASANFENLSATIGQMLLPVAAKAMAAFNDLLLWAQRNWPVFRQSFVNAWEQMKPAFDALIGIATTVKDTIAKHWGTIERNMLALKTVVVDALKIVRDAIELVNALLHGDWKEAWNNAKQIASSVIDGIKTILTNQLQNILQLAGALGRAVWNGFRDGITGIGEFFLGVITGLKDMLVNQLENLRAKAVDLGTAIKNGIVSGVTGLGLAIWDLLKALPEFLLEKIAKAPELFSNIGEAIKDAIVDGVKGLGASIWDKVSGEITSLPGRIRDKIGDGGGGVSDAGGGGNFSSAGVGVPSLMGASAVMAPFASAASRFGLVVTSGLRPGAITANGTPSDHGFGKALDVAGSAAGMAAFFRSLVGNPAVKQAFYDPLGSIFGGALNGYREGGHSDHVHVATYDKGGYLKPGWNLAYNGLGRPEPVGFGGNTTINVYGSMIHERDLDARIREGVLREQNRGRGI